MSVALRSRWLVVSAAVLAGAVALFAVFGYAVAPGLLRDLVADELGAALDRPVQVERVEVRPFALAATFHGLDVAHKDGKRLLRVEAIEVDGSIASLWQRAPIVDRLRVLRPELAVARLDATRYDVSDLLDRWLARSSDPPPRFSLNNVEVVQGRIAFDDRPQRQVHAVEALEVGVPFLSTLPYAAQIDVQPKLAATIDGAPFALAGFVKPFAERREATLDVDVDRLPLPRYVGYLPVQIRAKLADGALTTRLKLTFAQVPGEAPALSVGGTLSLARLDVRRLDGAPLAAAREVAVEVDRLDAAARTLRLASVTMDAPALALRRLHDGSLELAGLLGERADGAGAPGAPWRVEVAKVGIEGGRASVEDASVTPAYRAEVTDLVARATTLANTAEPTGAVDAVFRIDNEATAKLAGQVALTPFALSGRFEVANARLARLYPYAAGVLDLAVQRGSADYASSFELGAGGEVRLAGGKAAVRDLALAASGEREPLWRMPDLAVDGIDVDVAKRSVAVAAVSARGPQVRLQRDAGGAWNLARLMRTTATTGTATGGAADDTWQLRIAKATVVGGDVHLADASTAPPLALRLREVALVVTDVGNARDMRSGLDLRARIDGHGRLAVKGPFTTNPFGATLDVQAERLPLLAAKPLIEREANVLLTAGTAGVRGRLEATPDKQGALRFAWRGDVALADVETLDPPTGGRLFAWKSLRLEGLAVRTEPFEASVDALAIADFYARLIVYADATINLAKLDRTSGDVATAPAKGPGKRAGAVATVAHTAERTLRRAVDGALPIAVGRITLANGNVNFSDFFIRPNYSVNLTQVAGTVSALSPAQAGEIAITAKVDDAAPVTIAGRLQPFARDLSLALAGKARDIELAPLSPYAAKYAGYGITKGKLSLDVDYAIDNGKLDAKNRLVLDQLTFGERVESPDATRLPVLLAVALLKDANGVIDIDLPISGTLDDPQFSVWGLIVRVVVNLLAKAATAPFALLGAIAGGGEELAWIEFGGGSVALDADANARLDKLGKALAARPGLKVDVTGRVDVAADREALARDALERALRSAKLKGVAAKGEAPASVDAVVVAADERAQWLAAAYAALPAEARTREPAAKEDVTPAEMERALARHLRPDDAAVNELGLARARAAKDALVARGVAAERVFLVAPKPGDATGKGGPRRVDFALR